MNSDWFRKTAHRVISITDHFSPITLATRATPPAPQSVHRSKKPFALTHARA
jgi:hypothetical protein